MKAGTLSAAFFLCAMAALAASAEAAECDYDAGPAAAHRPVLTGNEAAQNGRRTPLRRSGSLLDRLDKSPHRRQTDAAILRKRCQRLASSPGGAALSHDHRTTGPRLPVIPEQTLRARHSQLGSLLAIVTSLTALFLLGASGCALYVLLERRYKR